MSAARCDRGCFKFRRAKAIGCKSFGAFETFIVVVRVGRFARKLYGCRDMRVRKIRWIETYIRRPRFECSDERLATPLNGEAQSTFSGVDCPMCGVSRHTCQQQRDQRQGFTFHRAETRVPGIMRLSTLSRR